VVRGDSEKFPLSNWEINAIIVICLLSARLEPHLVKDTSILPTLALANQKNPRDGKLRFPFFRLAIKIG
jgi:hypothetical protein